MLMKKENAWKLYSKEKKEEAFDFSEDYKKFLNANKTERQFVKASIELSEKYGFVNAEAKEKLNKGDKIYYLSREKNLVLVIVGEEDIEKGMNFVVSHVDVPRLDLKQNPLYEDKEIALLRTHYYGGVKKYQWVSMPLALHGVVVLEDGSKVEVSIGEDDNDPVFTIPDILPHLSKKAQDDRKAREVVKGEELVLIVGSMPSAIDDQEIKEKVKYAVLEKMNKNYGFKEENFITAEFEVVPAIKAKDVGLDRAILGSYGHDDRICGYTSLKAILNIAEEGKVPSKTIVCYMADKEEIGSTGSTGLQSRYLDYFVSDLVYKLKENYNEYMVKKALWNSFGISADVSAAINPLFKSVHEEQNAAKISYGIAVSKYTGHGGKYSSNDADAEYVAKIVDIFNRNNVIWQTAALGKVDEGGGGTVAKFLAHYGISTIDAGPALISMHSPFELASKLDIYESYRAYKAFFRS